MKNCGEMGERHESFLQPPSQTDSQPTDEVDYAEPNHQPSQSDTVQDEDDEYVVMATVKAPYFNSSPDRHLSLITDPGTNPPPALPSAAAPAHASLIEEEVYVRKMDDEDDGDPELQEPPYVNMNVVKKHPPFPAENDRTVSWV